ncbi:hypothetical protein B0H15DRAFT_821749 [Mycena belliarum]|uniref:Uncharacterized protein n=1 Tax=Mycena belliarum TaxID=1033014 RepID=A0AAD6UES6_9AGAR|nr:hypothetical protein B0H15DRAFT_821749 [Mycena belliae]
MPPKPQPKIFQILVKTHKLTILITVLPTITVGALKTEIFSALASDVNQGADVPPVSSVGDFELCKGSKERGKLTGEYTPLDNPKQALKDAGVVNWEPLFVQFRDPDSGELLPVVFIPFEDDEDEVSQQFSAPAPPPAEASTSRGKRKARPD